jgi:hypothetical protein
MSKITAIIFSTMYLMMMKNAMNAMILTNKKGISIKYGRKNSAVT